VEEWNALGGSGASTMALHKKEVLRAAYDDVDPETSVASLFS
jgi:hypothetical protein